MHMSVYHIIVHVKTEPPILYYHYEKNAITVIDGQQSHINNNKTDNHLSNH